jgi:hypothetical protein
LILASDLHKHLCLVLDSSRLLGSQSWAVLGNYGCWALVSPGPCE